MQNFPTDQRVCNFCNRIASERSRYSDHPIYFKIQWWNQHAPLSYLKSERHIEMRTTDAPSEFVRNACKKTKWTSKVSEWNVDSYNSRVTAVMSSRRVITNSKSSQAIFNSRYRIVGNMFVQGCAINRSSWMFHESIADSTYKKRSGTSRGECNQTTLSLFSLI